MSIAMDKFITRVRVRVRDARGDMSKLLKSKKKEKKKITHVYCIWRCSQAKI